MKASAKWGKNGSSYAISGMSAQEFVELRDCVVEAAASKMLFAYQWPSGYTKRQRNAAFRLLKTALLDQEQPDELTKRALRKFKADARAERFSGHFRGGKWRNVDYSKRV